MNPFYLGYLAKKAALTPEQIQEELKKQWDLPEFSDDSGFRSKREHDLYKRKEILGRVLPSGYSFGLDPVSLLMEGAVTSFRDVPSEVYPEQNVAILSYTKGSAPNPVEKFKEVNPKELAKEWPYRYLSNLKQLLKFFKHPNLKKKFKNGEALELIDFRAIKPEAAIEGVDKPSLGYVGRVRRYFSENGKPAAVDYVVFYSPTGTPAMIIETDLETGKLQSKRAWKANDLLKKMYRYLDRAFAGSHGISPMHVLPMMPTR